jgi:hypothetical protein
MFLCCWQRVDPVEFFGEDFATMIQIDNKDIL